MRICSLAGALVSLGAALVQAQSSTAFQLEHGRLRLRAPVAWHLLGVEDSGAQPNIIFHIRNPATDSGKARANVIIEVSRWSGHSNTRELTDSLFHSMYDGYAILGDTMPAKDRRFYFWAGREDDVPYTIYDDFARRGDLLVHVRIAWPLTPKSAAAWVAALSSDTETFLASIVLDGTRLFPGWAGHPNVNVWSPSGSERQLPNDR